MNFKQKPNRVCYHALLGFYLCQSKIHKYYGYDKCISLFWPYTY